MIYHFNGKTYADIIHDWNSESGAMDGFDLSQAVEIGERADAEIAELRAELQEAEGRADTERNTRILVERRAKKAETELAERPTTWAYEQACRALDKHRQRVDELEDIVAHMLSAPNEVLHQFRPVLADAMEAARTTLPAGRGEGEPEANPEGAGASPEVLSDLMSLVMDPWPSAGAIGCWSAEDRALAEEWAAAVHLRASDHYDIEVPPKPAAIARWERVGVVEDPLCARCGKPVYGDHEDRGQTFYHPSCEDAPTTPAEVVRGDGGET